MTDIAKSPGSRPGRLILSQFMEWGILLLLAFAAIALPVCPAPMGVAAVNEAILRVYFGSVVSGVWPAIQANLLGGAAGLYLILALIVLTRTVRSRPLFLLLAMAIPLGGLGYFFWAKVLPVIREVESSTPIADLRPGIPVSFIFLSLRPGLVLLVPILAGLYATRTRWSPLFYALGWAAGLAVMYVAFYGWWGPGFGLNMAVAVALNAAFASAAVLLPIQQRMMEGLTGIPMREGSPSPAATPSAFAATLGHLSVALIGVATVYLAFASYYEFRVNELLVNGPRPVHASPALANAFPILKANFTRTPGDAKDKAAQSETAIQKLLKVPGPADQDLLSGIPVLLPEQLAEYVRPADGAKLDAFLAAMEPHFSAVEQAGRAEIYSVPRDAAPSMPDFLAIRTTARALDLRAAMAVSDGRTTDALRDIEMIFRFSHIMGTDPAGTLVGHMVASAVRGIGISAAQNFYLATRDNPAAAAALAATLDSLRPLVHASLPVGSIRRGEPAFWPMAVYYEMMVPSMTRAYVSYYSRWAAFDQLRILLALDAYRDDTGKYPSALGDLVPRYLDRVPVDPFEGKPYEYEVSDGEPLLEVAYLRRPEVRTVGSPLVTSTKEIEAAGQKELEKRRAARQESRTP